MRRGDNAPISVLELVGEELKPKRKKRTKAQGERQQPTKETPEARSRKKEAAEELGLIEGGRESKEASPEPEAPPQKEETPSEPKKEAE